MEVATVVNLDSREVLDAIADRAKLALGSGGHIGGREIAVRFDDAGKVTGAVVTFSGKVSDSTALRKSA